MESIEDQSLRFTSDVLISIVGLFMKHEIRINFRINVKRWESNERFYELLEAFERYRGVTDQITFFTASTHAALPIDTIKECADILSHRIRAVRDLGYETGINHLSTIGHHDENLANALVGEYVPITDIDGNTCRGIFCPNDPRVREYIGESYEILVNADPDYIWIDDDVRLCDHIPLGTVCFCDNCLQRFSSEFGKTFDRETLRDAFDVGSVEKKLELRKAWIAHNRKTMNRLFELIERTVHRAKPDLPIGFMAGERLFEGLDHNHWANILSGPDHVPVYWRPGAVWFNDDDISRLIAKAHSMGRQSALLGDSVTSTQSEIENFPYQTLRKSLTTLSFEILCDLAAGATGTAVNALGLHDEPLDEFEPIISVVQQQREFHDRVVSLQGQLQPAGAYFARGKDIAATVNITTGHWFDRDLSANRGANDVEIFEIGIPIAYAEQENSIALLSGDTVLGMPLETIERILHGSVYHAWQYLLTLSKSSQIKSIFRWLSRDRLLAYVRSYHKIHLWPRRTPEGNVVVTIANIGFDTAEDVEFAIRTQADVITVHHHTGTSMQRISKNAEDTYSIFKIPAIEPLEVVVACDS